MTAHDKSQRPDLVIFDCDGVLVDSELITNRVFVQMLNELGLPVTLEDMFEQFVGRSMADCCVSISRQLRAPLPEGFVAQYQARTAAALQSQLQPIPGIEALLDVLRARGVPFCVASSGSHEKMRMTLGITGLLPRFDGKLFSVTEVAHGKPAPDVYLYAARRVGVEPARCQVVEDTPTGVAAGVAAGMTVCGYCAFTPARRLFEAGAHYTVDEMSKLPGIWFGLP